MQLEILIDGTSVGMVRCSEFRQDLKDRDISDGFAAFKFAIPHGYRDGRAHRIDLRHRGEDGVVVGAPRKVIFGADERARKWVKRFRSYIVQGGPTNAQRVRLNSAFLGGARHKVAVMVGYTSGIDPAASSNRLIDELRANGFFVLHVHASPAADTATSWEITSSADAYFLKHNVGYDFGSWLTGLAMVWKFREQIDELLFVNDSNLGPVHALRPALAPSHLDRHDIFGLIDNFDTAHHLQSYFVRFSRKVLQGNFLPAFAAQYPITADKSEIVKHGEIGLSQMARDFGLDVGCLVDTDTVRRTWIRKYDSYRTDAIRAVCDTGFSAIAEDTYNRFEEIKTATVRGVALNPTHYYRRTLFEEFQFPFVKRDLILRNPVDIPDWHLIPTVLSAKSREFGNWVFELATDNAGLVPLSASPFAAMGDTPARIDAPLSENKKGQV
ncbi:rhamnan synthesis F family protein [Pseudaestuariivita atlantica]|uniref:Uncharacterized protein n=1 Tax=Pseudaestuariivita atlantica TaxID=1317121 RepID=A0A0L1JUE5_9RHOB|nr:rhamnan synthesis F family protein [Pseudaestuariivita atlantica]KNG95312.1 hypothetical protein ATO11_01400 [Pseudaestuariivita atlantica]